MRYIPNIILSIGCMLFPIHIIGNMIDGNNEKTFNSVLATIISIGLLAILTEIQKLNKD
jgi:hypothetical protein